MDESGMDREGMNRRDFAGMLTGLLAIAGTFAGKAEGQAAGQGNATAAAGARPAGGMKELTSGVYKPIAGRGMQGGHESHQYLTGMLKAGNIRLEMHESVQQAGAPHEAVGTHLHSEIWLMQRGVATLYLNGVEHKMEAGDVGLCCAGDEHWIANAGDSELAYFVVTVGPPE
ncbi:MAG: cupin domain-containing protein [Acidobacteriaceae bacterium]